MKNCSALFAAGPRREPAAYRSHFILVISRQVYSVGAFFLFDFQLHPRNQRLWRNGPLVPVFA